MHPYCHQTGSNVARAGGSVRWRLRALLFIVLLACWTFGLGAPQPRAEEISRNSLSIVHQGGGLFSISTPPGHRVSEMDTQRETIDLKRIAHGYDSTVDLDVVPETDITLNDRVGPLIDDQRRPYAMLTLYQIDPPLADLPSRDPGVDRGIDMRSPANMVKSAYSNYVSPVVTDDRDRHPVAGHPIGHFLVKLEIPGYPALLTGMTTIQRADRELADWTIGRELGIGGVLLTPQPGRLNTAEEAMAELQLRQRRLRVIDGVFYRRPGKVNLGPEYIIEDGNVVFARFKLPQANAKDALAVFVEFILRGQHKIFGSLINRPYRGTGSGCTPFAMSWLKASGIVPFVVEPEHGLAVQDMTPVQMDSQDFWRGLFRTAEIPWEHIGCDERVGASRIVPADYTVYDHLFYGESTLHLLRALPGLADKIREEQGTVIATLFAFGALTPLRDLVTLVKRKDPEDKGDYRWAPPGKGFTARFWDNGRFSDWIKRLWASQDPPEGIALAREGRFLGIEIDAMNTPRQTEPFFAEADRIQRLAAEVNLSAADLDSCRSVFGLGLQ
jgi:hypothetical protein